MHETITKLTLFEKLSLKEQVVFSKWFVARTHKRGEALYHEGERVGHLVFVVRGKIKLVKHTPQGKDVILAIVTPGEAVNLEATLGPGAQLTTAIAVEDSAVVVIERQVFRKLAESYPGVLRASAEILALHVAEQLDLVKELSVAKVDSRIAGTLLRLGDKLGTRIQDGPIQIDIHLSRQDIADLSGTTIESAIRTLSRFGRERLVTTTKESILIEDRESLADIAGMF